MNHNWAYPNYGEPFHVELCENGIQKLLGRQLHVFEAIQVEISNKWINDN